ncbi:MAG: hypothetical protein ACK501_13830 [Planctomycetota bacterium]
MNRTPRTAPQRIATNGLALAALFATALPAQQPAALRHPAFVEVVGPDGTAVAGAEVRAFHRGGDAWPGDTDDRVTALADRRGIALLRLLPGEYSVHAVLAPGFERAAVSEMRDGLRQGARCTLQLGPALLPQQVVLDGLSSWMGRGPLRVRVAAAATQIEWRDLLVDMAPPMPTIGMLAVFDRDGRALWGAHLDRTHAGEPSARLPVFRLAGAPYAFAVRVVTPGGRPVAGAEVARCFPEDFTGRARAPMGTPRSPELVRSVLGVTDAEGVLHTQVAYEHGADGDGTVAIEARAAGFGAGRASATPRLDARDRATFDPGDLVLEVALTKPLPLHLEPPTACELTLFGVVPGASWAVLRDEGVERVQVSADGIAALPWPHWHHWRQPFDRPREEPPSGPLRLARIEVKELATAWAIVEPGEDRAVVDVARTTTKITVVDENGSAAAGLHLALWPSHPDAAGVVLEAPIAVDHRGRASVRIGRGRWLLVAFDATRFAYHVLEGAARPEQVELRLQVAETATLCLLDADDKPCPGEWLRLVPSATRPGDGGEWFEPLMLDLQRGMWRSWQGLHRTDGEGCVRVPLAGFPGLKTALHVTQTKSGAVASVPWRGTLEAGKIVAIERR